MARISIEDCLQRIENRFALVHLVAERARQLSKGSRPMMETKNKNIVTALREVAEKKVFFAKVLNEKEISNR